MKDFITGDLPGILVVSLFIFGIVFIVGYYIYDEHARDERLMTQCLDDGRKEYECYNLIKKRSNNTLIIPMR